MISQDMAMQGNETNPEIFEDTNSYLETAKGGLDGLTIVDRHSLLCVD
jgi:hypothetical protein